MNQSKLVRRICFIGIVSALYSVTTIVLAPFSFGAIQVRISEALTLVAVLCPEAIIAVSIGCAISNFVGALMGVNIIGFMDVLFGTMATLIAAFLTYKCRNIRYKNLPLLSAIWPVLLNGIIIGAQLAWVLAPQAFWEAYVIIAAEIMIGEAVTCYGIGIPLALRLEKMEVMKRFGL